MTIPCWRYPRHTQPGLALVIAARWHALVIAARWRWAFSSPVTDDATGRRLGRLLEEQCSSYPRNCKHVGLRYATRLVCACHAPISSTGDQISDLGFRLRNKSSTHVLGKTLSASTWLKWGFCPGTAGSCKGQSAKVGPSAASRFIVRLLGAVRCLHDWFAWLQNPLNKQTSNLWEGDEKLCFQHAAGITLFSLP